MTDSDDIGLYGTPPAALMPPPSPAIQFSPLIPGAEALERRGNATLAGLVMLAPPGTIERRTALAHALRTLKPGASLTVLAPKDKGGTRIGKELTAFGCIVSDTARRHYRICRTTKPQTVTGLDDAIAEGAPRLLPELGLWSQPGIFGWDRLDPGSALLMQNLPPLTGTGADFGCGMGTLARAVLASPAVRHLTLIDVDRRAIEATRRNIDDPRVTLHWADLRTSSVRIEGLDFVIMNPPFHDGGAEDKALGQSFIRRAAEALRPGGTCWLTANRHLPYEGVMKPLFSRMTLKADEGGYKVYEAIK
jgi:16S rRNA (guanine1207-N2)-methyltransferase